METPSFYTNKIFQISSSFLLPDTLTKGQVIMYRLRGGEEVSTIAESPKI